jgi:hypothetical protein
MVKTMDKPKVTLGKKGSVDAETRERYIEAVKGFLSNAEMDGCFIYCLSYQETEEEEDFLLGNHHVLALCRGDFPILSRYRVLLDVGKAISLIQDAVDAAGAKAEAQAEAEGGGGDGEIT